MAMFGLQGRNLYLAYAAIGVLVLLIAAGLWWLLRPQIFVVYSKTDGDYQFSSADDAYAAAKTWGYPVATAAQLQDAFNKGASTCIAGYVQGNQYGWPQQSLMPSDHAICGSTGVNLYDGDASGPIGVWLYGSKTLASRKFKGALWPWNDCGFQPGCRPKWLKPITKM